jgi:serralysin
VRRSHWPARAGLTALITIAVAAVAVPAEAASWGDATAGAKTVSFVADWKATNKIVITRSGRTVTIDDRVEIKPGKGCKRVKGDKTRVKCKTTKTPTRSSSRCVTATTRWSTRATCG